MKGGREKVYQVKKGLISFLIHFTLLPFILSFLVLSPTSLFIISFSPFTILSLGVHYEEVKIGQALVPPQLQIET